MHEEVALTLPKTTEISRQHNNEDKTIKSSYVSDHIFLHLFSVLLIKLG